MSFVLSSVLEVCWEARGRDMISLSQMTFLGWSFDEGRFPYVGHPTTSDVTALTVLLVFPCKFPPSLALITSRWTTLNSLPSLLRGRSINQWIPHYHQT